MQHRNYTKACVEDDQAVRRRRKKYMITSQTAKESENITIGNYMLEVVQTFTYLGSSVNCNNNISQEITKLILIANKCFYGLKNQLK
jgi:hypothetical protein